MQIHNCRRCGRVFPYAGIDTCTDCLDAEDDEFERVRAYLSENPGAQIDEASDATGVPRADILHFLRQGRIESQGVDTLNCQQCGTPIHTGRYCSSCTNKLMMSLQSVSGQPRPAVPPRPVEEEGNKAPSRSNSSPRVYLSDHLRRRRGF